MKRIVLIIAFAAVSMVLTYAQGSAHTQNIEIKEEYTIITEGAVDLGLPSGTLWSALNLGANTPYEAGDQYAWGDTNPYSQELFADDKYYVPWKYYKFYRIGGPDRGNRLTKYNTDEGLGFVDGKTSLELSDDMANIALGDGWRMPTKAEFEELADECVWVQYNVNGPRKDKVDIDFLSGYIVIGPNENAIFILATAEFTSPDYCTMYWSSELTEHSTEAYALYVDPYNNPRDSKWPDFPSYYVMRYERADFCCIRPVKAKR